MTSSSKSMDAEDLSVQGVSWLSAGVGPGQQGEGGGDAGVGRLGRSRWLSGELSVKTEERTERLVLGSEEAPETALLRR